MRNTMLWILVFLFNTKTVFSNQNHDKDNHPLAASVNCPNEADAAGRKYLTERMMHSETMFSELRHNIPGFKNLNNKQIIGMMRLMGPNYY